MKLVIATLPDDPTRVPGWLDRQLVGPDLAPLIAELRVVHGTGRDLPELASLLASSRDALLNRGLQVLPAAALAQLLTHPELLLELQELVLIEGGPYWQDLTREAFPVHLTDPVQPAPEPPPQRPRRRLLDWVLPLMSAAALLVAVFFWWLTSATLPTQPPVVASGWGWDKPGALPEDLPAPAYLDRLADAAGDWFKKRPEKSADLAKRLGDLRRGCSTLIFAAHPTLSPDERRWLQGRCRNWGTGIDEALAALEAGTAPLQVRGDVDQLVTRAVEELRAQARQSRG